MSNTEAQIPLLELLGNRIDSTEKNDAVREKLYLQKEILMNVHHKLEELFIKEIGVTGPRLSKDQLLLIKQKFSRIKPDDISTLIQRWISDWENALPTGQLTPEQENGVKETNKAIEAARELINIIKTFTVKYEHTS